jgi:hypothetical protein
LSSSSFSKSKHNQ